MSPNEIAVGVALRVIAPHWDRPVGTIGRMTETCALSVGNTWWFTVEWWTYLPKRVSHRLRMFEEDLSTFELVRGPIVNPLLTTRRKQQEERKPLPLQASLPFTQAGDDE